MEAFPPDWQEDLERLSDFINNLIRQYGERIQIRIFDPYSIQGLMRSLIYGIRRYPTFIVDGKQKIAGLDTALYEVLEYMTVNST